MRCTCRCRCVAHHDGTVLQEGNHYRRKVWLGRFPSFWEGWTTTTYHTIEIGDLLKPITTEELKAHWKPVTGKKLKAFFACPDT